MKNYKPLPNYLTISRSGINGLGLFALEDIPEGKEVGDVKEVKEMVKTFKDSIFFWKCAKTLQEAMAKIETLETKVTALENA